MREIRNIFGLRTVKTALGAALAIYLSQRLNLSYAVNSGIIVILSIQTTKRKSRDLAIMRLGSTILALAIGAIMFSVIGFTPLAFGAYLLAFIPLAVKLKFNDGIVPCSVLVTHLLAVQSVTLPWLGNEMMQMVIGAGIGFLLNLQMPSLEKKLNEDILEIEKLQRAILLNMAENLKNHKYSEKEDVLYRNLEEKLKNSHERALIEAENHLIKNVTYYVKYIEMRSVQFEIMRYMKKYSRKIYKITERTEMVEALTKIVADQLHELNTEDKLITEIVEYRQIFKSMELPTTREDFENRASLYEYVGDLEHLVDVKRSFVLNLDPCDLVKFQKDMEISEGER